jgi:predicted dehydrogenase
MHKLDEIRWGFVGCGEVTERKSGPAFSLVDHSQVVAVMSRSHEKAKDYAERHHIDKWYADAQMLINDPEVNAVYIATPPSSHATYAIMAMKAGKPVYVEKPLAASYVDCQRINRVSQETGVPCYVAYYRRELAYFKKVKEIIESGTIGKILTCQIRFACPPRDLDYNRTNLPWRVQRDIAGGGYFYDLAPHQIDLLQMCFGPIVRAHGVTANMGGLYATEDTVAATFQFQSGLVGSGSWCFVADDSAKVDRIALSGELGRISFSVFTYTPISLYTKNGKEEITIVNPPHVQLPLIEKVVKALRGEEDCEENSIMATSVNWVLDKILGKL